LVARHLLFDREESESNHPSHIGTNAFLPSFRFEDTRQLFSLADTLQQAAFSGISWPMDILIAGKSWAKTPGISPRSMHLCRCYAEDAVIINQVAFPAFARAEPT
jgi:hypothetical protein